MNRWDLVSGEKENYIIENLLKFFVRFFKFNVKTVELVSLFSSLQGVNTMAEGTYEYECNRAELLGVAPPSRVDWEEAERVRRENEQAEQLTV